LNQCQKKSNGDLSDVEKWLRKKAALPSSRAACPTMVENINKNRNENLYNIFSKKLLSF